MALGLYMIADGGRRGYLQLLDAFWDEARTFGLPLPTDRPVSGAAYCKARRKLPPATIRVLIHRLADRFEQKFRTTVRGAASRRFLAVDGTKVNLQRCPELAEVFGVPKGAYCPQALVSTLFDLSSRVPQDLVIGRTDAAEREQLVLLLDRLRPGDVLVLDRGYPSFELFRLLADAGIDFVVRVPGSNTFAAVGDFLAERRDDGRIVIHPPAGHAMSDAEPLELRAVRIAGPKGERTVILTSLRRSEFSRSRIAAVYRARWQIEEYYKVAKSDFLGPGQLHSRTAVGVQQELLSLALFVGMARSMMAAAAVRHQAPYEAMSAKSGVLCLAAYVVRLLLVCDEGAVQDLLDRILERIARNRNHARPGRSFPRRSLRPSRKWGPKGRRGG